MTSVINSAERAVLDVFTQSAGSDSVRAARLLAVSLGCGREEWVPAREDVFNLGPENASRAVDEASTWPFISRRGQALGRAWI